MALYYLGLGYLDDTGLVLGSNFKRYSGTFNGSYKITDDFKVSSNVLYAQSNKVGSFRDALSTYANEDDYFIFPTFCRASAYFAYLQYQSPMAVLLKTTTLVVTQVLGTCLLQR